jgi:hypothetical protein
MAMYSHPQGEVGSRGPTDRFGYTALMMQREHARQGVEGGQRSAYLTRNKYWVAIIKMNDTQCDHIHSWTRIFIQTSETTAHNNKSLNANWRIGQSLQWRSTGSQLGEGACPDASCNWIFATVAAQWGEDVNAFAASIGRPIHWA